MIVEKLKHLEFTTFYKKLNISSLILMILSILIILFKGLNLGVDFKGGTLIEIRSENENIKISEIRASLSNMNLGDITVKNFGNSLSVILS